MVDSKYVPGDILSYSLDFEGHMAGHNALVLPSPYDKGGASVLTSYILLVLGGPVRGSLICPTAFDVHSEHSVSKIAHVDLTKHLIDMSSFKLTLDEIIKLVPGLQQYITDTTQHREYVEYLD